MDSVTSVTSMASDVTHVKTFGGQSMVGNLRRVLVRRPDASYGNADPSRWHYTSRPDLKGALNEHEKFTEILKKFGIEVIYHDVDLPDHADAIFVHDPAIITNHGAIIFNIGKELRRGEEEAIKQKFVSLGIPILYELSDHATVEGGDTLWLDENTFCIGRGFRTNQKGIDEIKTVLGQFAIDVIQVDLPYAEGKDACLHLQSLISLVDNNVAVAYPKLMPVSFYEYLTNEQGLTLIEVPDSEFMSMGPNILALSPGVVLTIEGNPITKERMENAGITVLTYQGDEMSLKAEGGATCLTRPLLRDKKDLI